MRTWQSLSHSIDAVMRKVLWFGVVTRVRVGCSQSRRIHLVKHDRCIYSHILESLHSFFETQLFNCCAVPHFEKQPRKVIFHNRTLQTSLDDHKKSRSETRQYQDYEMKISELLNPTPATSSQPQRVSTAYHKIWEVEIPLEDRYTDCFKNYKDTTVGRISDRTTYLQCKFRKWVCHSQDVGWEDLKNRIETHNADPKFIKEYGKWIRTGDGHATTNCRCTIFKYRGVYIVSWIVLMICSVESCCEEEE
jgi:hypothetical protein